MSPKGEPRTHKFTLLLNDEEKAMLEQVAAEDQRTASDWIRVQFRKVHAERFGTKRTRKASK